jgi:hypothetical protein
VTAVTEQEWLACEDSLELLSHLGGELSSDRKSRLFAAASARRVLHLLPDAAREAIEAAEAFADGHIDKPRLKEVFKAAEAAARKARSARSAHHTVRDVSRPSASHCCWYVAWSAAYVADDLPDGREGQAKYQAALVRDIAGSPFREVAVAAAWQTPAATALAAAAYDDRLLPAGHLDAARLSVLADALEDAGCDNTDLVGHLRSPGPHVRGCWAIDLLLGKE